MLIRRSKGDQEGQGQEIAFPRGAKLRPVEALQAWLGAADITSGPVFRAVARGGRVSTTALSADAVPRIVKKFAIKPIAFCRVRCRPSLARRRACCSRVSGMVTG